jgi:hypothetical protein
LNLKGPLIEAGFFMSLSRLKRLLNGLPEGVNNGPVKPLNILTVNTNCSGVTLQTVSLV